MDRFAVTQQHQQQQQQQEEDEGMEKEEEKKQQEGETESEGALTQASVGAKNDSIAPGDPSSSISRSASSYRHGGALHLVCVMAAAQKVLRGLRQLGELTAIERARVHGACDEFVRVCRCTGYDAESADVGDAADVLLARISALAAAKFQQRGTTSVTSALAALVWDPTTQARLRRLARRVEGAVTAKVKVKALELARGAFTLSTATPPRALDPNSPLRLAGLLGTGLLLHTGAFRIVELRQGRGGIGRGRDWLGWSIFSTKLLTRYAMVAFLLARFAILHAEKRQRAIDGGRSSIGGGSGGNSGGSARSSCAELYSVAVPGTARQKEGAGKRREKAGGDPASGHTYL